MQTYGFQDRSPPLNPSGSSANCDTSSAAVSARIPSLPTDQASAPLIGSTLSVSLTISYVGSSPPDPDPDYPVANDMESISRPSNQMYF